MALQCGIVGLPNVGKSTLFNALTKAGIAAENYPFCTIEPNVGVVEVPDPRLQALAATTRLKLESLDGKAGTGAESDLLHKQLHLLNERTANLETSYQEELACHEETARFLARLATSRPESQAGQIRHILLHKASTREAEAFLDQFSQEPQNKPTLTAQAAVLSARLAEQRIDLPLALSRYTRALRIFPDNIEYLRLAGDLAWGSLKSTLPPLAATLAFMASRISTALLISSTKRSGSKSTLVRVEKTAS